MEKAERHRHVQCRDQPECHLERDLAALVAEHPLGKERSRPPPGEPKEMEDRLGDAPDSAAGGGLVHGVRHEGKDTDNGVEECEAQGRPPVVRE